MILLRYNLIIRVVAIIPNTICRNIKKHFIFLIKGIRYILTENISTKWVFDDAN